jgi:membrane-bound lytic murein transglycosylase D
VKIWVLLLCLLVALATRAQPAETPAFEDLFRNLNAWAQENLDTNVLAQIPKFDSEQAQQFLRNLQQRFEGEYVVNLAALRETANVLLPLLQSYEETQPYAAWLSPRLDYLKVADELLLRVPPPKTEPGQPTPPRPNPNARQQREVWVKEVTHRPWPPGASNLVTRLKPIFKAQQVPPELVWLAEVESSFDARAKSPVGAAGLFQLMPDTAKRFGLSLWPRDQRYQTDSSARAAAQYLKLLHERFQDWRLALAAYNAGEGNVQRLLKRHKTRSFDGIAAHLPAETQMFVPKVEAVLLRREGMTLEELSAGKR